MRRPEPRSGQERAEDQGDREVPGRPVLRSVPVVPAPHAALDDLLRPAVLTRLSALDDLLALFGPSSPEFQAARERLRLRAVPAPPADPEAE